MKTAWSALCGAMVRGLCVALPVALFGCASKGPAPVSERAVPPARAVAAPVPAPLPVARSGEFYIVKKGDTLYSIALEHGVAYRDVAAWNAIDNPAMIRVGQQLRVAPPEGSAVSRPIAAVAPIEARPLAAPAAAPGNTELRKREPRGGKQPFSEQAMAAAQKAEEPRPAAAPAQEPKLPAPADAGGDEGEWLWPAAGKVIGGFAEGSSKGIDLSGRIGDPVVASAAGKVIYAGSGIRGYGNLLILQHAPGVSSVYAHNSKLLAREGQQVAKGAKVAELGSTDTDQPKLHFEIRRQGKPVDPLKYLPAR